MGAYAPIDRIHARTNARTHTLTLHGHNAHADTKLSSAKWRLGVRKKKN